MNVAQLKVIKKNDSKVVTTSQLAEVYGTDTKTVSNNFTRNKGRYQEGKHYFLVKGEELKEFKTNHQIDDKSKHSPIIYLWTVKGALLHAKSLGTDQAWTAYENLVDDYFNKVEQLQQYNIPTEMPTTIEDVLLLAIGSMKDMKFEISELKQSNRNLSLIVDNEIWITDHQRADIKEAINQRIGHLKSKFIDAHFQGVYTALNTYFNVPKYDKIKRSDFESAIEFINGWFPKKKENSL